MAKLNLAIIESGIVSQRAKADWIDQKACSTDVENVAAP